MKPTVALVAVLLLFRKTTINDTRYLNSWYHTKFCRRTAVQNDNDQRYHDSWYHTKFVITHDKSRQ